MDAITQKPAKPLGSKAYGSIGHLPQSRLGPGDWHVHEGQGRICLEKPRKGDRVIVSEKLDGACMSVAKIDGAIVALTRAGYRAEDATYDHLRAFAPYVRARKSVFDDLLKEGERVCGEWTAMAHGTRYDADNPNYVPFIAFDIFRSSKRILRDEFRERCAPYLVIAATVHDGAGGCSIDMALSLLGDFGHHGSIEKIEGAVWRIEREGRVDFLAKYVRPDKIDGKYLPNISDAGAIWNWTEAAL